ncbi:MAG: hypothetical protein M0Q13_09290 [Methanothrix sp.]|jgi:hypothetical protein|nr:hypothetical protein [Methanothrix sp.]
MEEYANTKTETFDELVTKHTRRDLEELALKYGLENLGGTKSQLAEYILEAMKKQKEPPKSTPHVSPKEASMIEKPKSAAKPAGFGKKGVLAKANSIDNKAVDLKKAGMEIRDEGIREMTKAVKEFQAAGNTLSRNMHAEAQKMIEDGQKRFDHGQVQFKRSIDAQIKENFDSAAKLHSGAREIVSSQEKMSREFQKAGKSIRDEGYRNLQNGVAKFQSNLNSQIKENREAVSRIYSGAKELQGRAASFQNEIHKYQEQDLKNYVRDFYYG